MDFTNAVELVENIYGNPWLILFAALWVVGWLLKDHSRLNNDIIPWALALCGVILGLLVIDVSIAGGVVGGLAAYLIIGLYEQYKSGKNIVAEYKNINK